VHRQVSDASDIDVAERFDYHWLRRNSGLASVRWLLLIQRLRGEAESFFVLLSGKKVCSVIRWQTKGDQR